MTASFLEQMLTIYTHLGMLSRESFPPSLFSSSCAGLTRASAAGTRFPEDAGSASEHRRKNPVGGLMPVDPCLDVDDHFFTHVDATFDGGGPHMRHQHGFF
jgi:hypothetical protein